MKQLHYAGQVFTISDRLSDVMVHAVTDFIRAGRSALWPVAAYQDEREVVAQVLIGPGVSFLIVPSWFPDLRNSPQYDLDSITFIEGDHQALEAGLLN